MSKTLLVDENVARSTGKVFADKGFDVKYVYDDQNLRGKDDHDIFYYAVENETETPVILNLIQNLVASPSSTLSQPCLNHVLTSSNL